MNKLIVLDAGHGGTDPGAVSGSRKESKDTLDLALAVQKLLSERGINVLMTRTSDVFVSLQDRVRHANQAKADLFVSLHRNSFTKPTANGIEVWVYTTAGAIAEAFAGAVLEELDAAGAQSNRGIKKGNYHVLRESKMPAILVEAGFISNTIDNKFFDKNFNAYAEGVARGICTALGIPYQAETTPPVPKYKVQVGAFSQESNAREFLEHVREMGLSAYLVIQEEPQNKAQ